MGAGLMPAGAALRSHTAKNPETDASGAKNGVLKGLNPCQNPKNPSKCRAERLAVSNCAVVQQPVRAIAGMILLDLGMHWARVNRPSGSSLRHRQTALRWT